MSFQEKSAWVMSCSMLIGGAFYFWMVFSMSIAGKMATPILPFVIVFTVLLVVVAVIGHIVVAVSAPKDANERPDERDRKVIERAGYISGKIFGAGIIVSLGIYLFFPVGNILFYAAFSSLIIGQFFEYVFQIMYYRSVL